MATCKIKANPYRPSDFKRNEKHRWLEHIYSLPLEMARATSPVPESAYEQFRHVPYQQLGTRRKEEQDDQNNKVNEGKQETVKALAVAIETMQAFYCEHFCEEEKALEITKTVTED